MNATPATYQNRSGGWNVLPSTSRASPLRSDNPAGYGVSWANSTSQQNATAADAVHSGPRRGTRSTASA